MKKGIKRPGFSSKEFNQDNYLVHLRTPGRWFISAFLALLTFGAYFALENGGLKFIEQFNQESLENQSTLIGVVSTFLLIYIILLIQLFPVRINSSRQQKFKTWQRLLRNLVGVGWMSLIIFIIAIPNYPYFFPNGREGGLQVHLVKDLLNSSDFFPISIGVFIFLLLYYFLIKNLFRIFKLAFQHGTVIADFNQDFYLPGSILKVAIIDRQASNPHLKYRVHLSFVEEGKVIKDKKGKSSITRTYLYSDYQDLNPITLAKGIAFTLPKPSKLIPILKTDISNRINPRFWEIVVEEIDGYFFAGFTFDVK